MTKRKKASSRPAPKRPRSVTGVKKSEKSATDGVAAAAVATKKVSKTKDVDPNQKQLPGMDQERCAPVEGILKRHRDRISKIAAMKEEDRADTAKLSDLFKKHGLLKYTAAGFMVTVIPGADEIKFKKVKEA